MNKPRFVCLNGSKWLGKRLQINEGQCFRIYDLNKLELEAILQIPEAESLLHKLLIKCLFLQAMIILICISPLTIAVGHGLRKNYSGSGWADYFEGSISFSI